MWSITEKTVLITGATSGIGRETAIALASKGARVVLGYRNPDRVRVLQNDLYLLTGRNHEGIFCDLSSLGSIRKMADEFIEKFGAPDVLINNAGTWETTRKESADGIEMNFAVNHLSVFLLTRLLLPGMLKKQSARIITVSSSAHRSADFDTEDPDLIRGWSWFKAYSRSKLANVLFTRHLAGMLKGTAVTANCLHPGVVRTDIFKNMSWFTRLVFGTIMISPRKGAENSVYLATSPEVSDISGQYFVKCKAANPSKTAQNEALATRLWEISNKLVGFNPNSSL